MWGRRSCSRWSLLATKATENTNISCQYRPLSCLWPSDTLFSITYRDDKTNTCGSQCVLGFLSSLPRPVTSYTSFPQALILTILDFVGHSKFILHSRETHSHPSGMRTSVLFMSSLHGKIQKTWRITQLIVIVLSFCGIIHTLPSQPSKTRFAHGHAVWGHLFYSRCSFSNDVDNQPLILVPMLNRFVTLHSYTHRLKCSVSSHVVSFFLIAPIGNDTYFLSS